MRKSLLLLFIPALALGACAHKRSNTPDEFAVARNAPLVIPPDYTLTPPVAGTAGLNPADAQTQAIDALFGGPAPRSNSESSLLDQAGRDDAPVGIRSTVWDPDTRIVDKGPMTVQILTAPAGGTNVATAQVGQ